MASPIFTKDQKVQGPKVCWQNYDHRFLDSQGVILVDFLPKGETINSEVYIETLRKLKAKI